MGYPRNPSKLDERSAKQSRADMEYHEVCGSILWLFEQMCPAMQVFQRKYATLCPTETAVDYESSNELMQTSIFFPLLVSSMF